MTVTPLKHIVFVTGPVWTHVRPGVKFCARLAEKFSNAYISIYTFGPTSGQPTTYLATLSEAARSRVRIVSSMVDIPIASPLDIIFSMDKSFKSWITEQVAVSSFEANDNVVAPPSWIIEDHINGGCSLGNGLPVASWWVSTAASMIQHFGNPEHGHGGRLFDKILDELVNQESGSEKSTVEVFHEVLSDRVVCIPGLPPYYEYEQIPQMNPDFMPLTVQLHKRWNVMRDQMEIAVLSCNLEMEPIAVQACATAFTQPVRVFEVGPATDLPSTTLAPQSDSTIDFLDKSYSELGPHSVVYIAFGTMFFPLPQSARHLEIILEEIIASGFRLVFSLSSEQAALSEKFMQEMMHEGKAIFPKWTQQLQVLEHPATHYFMSHGGWNSTSEAIMRGVPMIFWPFAGDHPTNTMQVTSQHDCGFELRQVRTGPAKRPAYPNVAVIGTEEAVRDEIRDILEMSKGSRGRQQRANMRALGQVMRDSIAKGGSGDIALGEFGKLIGL
ncbi:glycosyltransferase family 1 protein [Ceratobasidium sp. AG-Ba]|nr:glycosyltransferase family 1 protein [Ceratobasidium sp. AG-Ba]